MRLIRAEGLEFYYFSQRDDPDDLCRLLLSVPALSPYMRNLLFPWLVAESPSEMNAFARDLIEPEPTKTIRMAAVPIIPGGERGDKRGDIYYLQWRGTPDLYELDRRVECGTYSDEDFAGSVLTHYQKTLCRACGRSWHTLVVPPDTYIGLGDLYRKKMDPWRKVVKSCPRCKASLRQLVIRIFDRA